MAKIVDSVPEARHRKHNDKGKHFAVVTCEKKRISCHGGKRFEQVHVHVIYLHNSISCNK